MFPSKEIHVLIPVTCRILLLCMEKVPLRVWFRSSQEDHPWSSRWALNAVTLSLQERGRGRFEYTQEKVMWRENRDLKMLALYIGVMQTKPRNAGRHWKLERSRNRSSSKASRESLALPTLDFSPLKWILDSNLHKYENAMLFSATKFVVICYNSHQKLIHPLSILVSTFFGIWHI